MEMLINIHSKCTCTYMNRYVFTYNTSILCTYYSGSKSSPNSTPSNSSSAGLALAAVLGLCGMSPSGSV